jgi:23S rRNA (adenine2503-C2)-methyltransferase
MSHLWLENMKWIYELTFEKLTEEIADAGLKTFAAGQIFQWIYQKNEREVSGWSNISKINREKLAGMYDTRLKPVLDAREDGQGTRKLLIGLEGDLKIECVLIKEKDHYTFCLSTQVGCALGCRFCATGGLGFTRNLSAGEILTQLLLLKTYIPGYVGKLNLVFMGMGEPLLNYGNLKQALGIIIAEHGVSVSPRNITVSTAGILKPLQRLERDFPRVKISFSLNAPTSHLREQLMPVNRKEPLNAFLDYFRASHRKHRITFEYVLLKGVNDSLEDAGKLGARLKGIPCKVNLIPYNENKGLPFKTPDTETVDAFSEFLHQQGYTVVVRWSKGRGIGSACGQLAGEAGIE